MTPCRLLHVATLLACLLLLYPGHAQATERNRVPIQIENHQPGAPITIGIPFPKGELHSPDHVRLLSAEGQEVPTQVTEVNTWAPADSSLKWIWVFFFAEEGDEYELEYGTDVRRAPISGDRITFENNQRVFGSTEIDTGPLRIQVDKRGGAGFLDAVYLDTEGDGFAEEDLIAQGPEGRGSFLDFIDDAGPDSSHAVVDQTFREKGSGPLHAILRIEGEYRYENDDKAPSPFITRVHAYAGRSYLRVLHTLTYTGEPDQHTPQEGEHAPIATQGDVIIDEEEAAQDPGWTEPKDRIAGAGLVLDPALSGPYQVRVGYFDGPWWNPEEDQVFEASAVQEQLSIFQTGPDPTGIPPVSASSPTERIGGFEATLTADDQRMAQAEQAEGWLHISDGDRSIGIGIRNFLEEYPKEISVAPGEGRAWAYLWTPSEEPMSFARWSSEPDGGMVGNFAQGLTKTSELVFSFQGQEVPPETVEQRMDYVLDPPVAHAPPQWYVDSRAFGHMAPRSSEHASFERGMDYKQKWWRFNQGWEPWYGMFYYGDGKNYLIEDEWYQWNLNEPALDYMWWLQFVRTGERDHYLAAEAMSRHTMDVGNIHWPTDPEYRGDTNSPLDWWEAKEGPSGSPYVGMGRRHGMQPWTSLLSAHVWVPGWLASYYLTGYHRGLDVARLTADYYRRRIFGEHGLTGRRLYLSVWNLVEVWDATKDERYRAELEDRVQRMLRLQTQQGGSLVIDRYGYSQVYVARGLDKYLQLTGDSDVRDAVIKHARWIRDNPPLDHEMESYLSSISVLLLGYQVSGESSFYREAYDRAQVLKTEEVDLSFEDPPSQTALADALEEASNLPPGRFAGQDRPIWSPTHGLRIFGWTHAYNVPYLVYWLQREGPPQSSDAESSSR